MCYNLPVTYHHKSWSTMTDKIFTIKTSIVVNIVHLAVVVPRSRNQIKLICGTLQCMYWYACTCSSQLLSVCRYVKLYGMKFSREDHLTFIYLMYQLVTIPNLEPWLVSKFAQALIILLKWVICRLCCKVLFLPNTVMEYNKSILCCACAMVNYTWTLPLNNFMFFDPVLFTETFPVCVKLRPLWCTVFPGRRSWSLQKNWCSHGDPYMISVSGSWPLVPVLLACTATFRKCENSFVGVTQFYKHLCLLHCTVCSLNAAGGVWSANSSAGMTCVSSE